MRVLTVSVDYPPLTRGGYELHCAAVVDALRRRGHDVRVLSAQRAGAAGDPPHVRRELPRVPPPPVAAPPAERRSRAVLDSHLAGFRPDAVMWWRMAELSVSLVERVACAGVPAVGVVCDPWMVETPRDYARAARWLFVSRRLHADLGARGVAVPLAGLAPPGVDPAAFPARPSAPPWRWRLLYAGRLSPLKGVDVAVRALAQLPEATLDVVGDGDRGYRARLAALGGGRVRVTPAVGRAELAARYRAADALLFPVRWREPWGLVPLEAMAGGTPVIAGTTAGPYLRHDENALLVAPDDPAGLAAAVRRLAGDPALRARLIAGGRATAARYPADRCCAVVADAVEAAAVR